MEQRSTPFLPEVRSLSASGAIGKGRCTSLLSPPGRGCTLSRQLRLVFVACPFACPMPAASRPSILRRGVTDVKSDRYSSDPFLRFLRDNPDLAREIEQLNNEGNRRMEAGNLRGALRCFRRLLAICPYSPFGNNNAGACYFYLGQYELGAKHFQRTLADYPDHVFALAMLARCQTAMGELEAAAQTLQRATSAFRQSNPHRGDEVTSVGIICDAFAELEDDRGLFDFFRRCGGRRPSQLGNSCPGGGGGFQSRALFPGQALLAAGFAARSGTVRQ